MIWKVQLTPDPQGYTTQQCKMDGCEKEFKVVFDQGDPIAHCPYCGYQGQFWTVEQIAYLDCMALNKLKKPKPSGPCIEPVEMNWPNKVHQFKCSGRTHNIKYKGPKKRFYFV